MIIKVNRLESVSNYASKEVETYQKKGRKYGFKKI